MDHMVRSRPQLPGTTPVTLASTKKSAYSSTSIDEGNFQRPASSHEMLTDQKEKPNPHTRLLSKLISRLPYEMRESIGSAFDMIVQAAELAKKEANSHKLEVLALQEDVSRKSAEILTLYKSADVYQQKIHALEVRLEEMKDNMDSRQKFLVKNRRSVDRMASTNRMLIGSLDSLQQTGGAVDADPAGGQSGRPSSSPGQPTTTGMSDKLRESLLRVSREHYASIKKVEVLEQSVDSLKSSLRLAEQKNRQLKLAIDELQSHHSDLHAAPIAAAAAQPNAASATLAVGSNANTTAVTWSDLPVSIPKAPTHSNSKIFGKLDDKFQNLVTKQALEPTEGLLVLRRILAFIASSPNTLQLADAAEYIASRELIRIFEAEMVCLYVVQPGSHKVVHKYTPRAREPEVINIDLVKSLVLDVLNNGQVIRINSMTRTSQPFYPVIDACPGVTVRRLLAVPLMDNRSGKVIGVIHLLNKIRSGVVYSESDEVFAQILADHASMLLSSCSYHERVETRSAMLAALLDVSADIYQVVPKERVFNAPQDLRPGDLLRILERLSMSALKCSKTRAFLNGAKVGGHGGELVMLNRKLSHNAKQPNPDVIVIGDYSGVVGKCVHEKKWISIEGIELESVLNPDIDIDPSGLTMVTVPLLNIEDEVIAILQLLPSTHSPPLEGTKDRLDRKEITFFQATQWFLYQISHSLNYLLRYVGKEAQRPLSAPEDSLHSPIGLFLGPELVSPSDQYFSDSKLSVEIANIRPKSSPSLSHSHGSSPTIPSNLVIDIPSGLMIPAMDKSIRHLKDSLEQIVGTDKLSPRRLLHVEDSANAVVAAVQEANVALTQMRSELALEKVESERYKSELANASIGYAKGIAALDAQIVELRERELVANDTIATLRVQTKARELTKLEADKEKDELAARLQKEHNEVIEKLTSLHQSAIKELRLKSDEKDSLIQKHQKSISALSNEISGVNQLLVAQKALTQDTQNRIDELTAELETKELSINQTQRQLEIRDSVIAERDALIGVLQNELVKLAESNLKALDGTSGRPLVLPSETIAPSMVLSARQSSGNQTQRQLSDQSTPITQAIAPSRQESNNFRDAGVAASEGLPAGWALLDDEHGNAYYYNSLTGESTWDCPTSDTLDEWQQVTSENGAIYWRNNVTGASQWDAPSILEPHGGYAIEL